MAPWQSFLAQWQFNLPNLVLAALVYLLAARLILSLLPVGDNIATRTVTALTEPVLKVVHAITPRAVPTMLAIVLAMAWIIAARVALIFAGGAMGVRLSMG